MIFKVLFCICIIFPTFSAKAIDAQQWHHRFIQSYQSWKVTKGSTQIVVAVIDNGVDFNHPDLKDSTWRNSAEILNGIDDDNNGYIDDIYGWNFLQKTNSISPDGNSKGAYHGTHIAGTIAGANNKLKISGVAPMVKIMALPFLDSKKSGKTDDGIEAIHYAIDQGAHIINLSWGSFNRNSKMMAALKKAERKGVLVVAASGNYSSNVDNRPFYPATYRLSNLISVGALNKSGKWLAGTNYGPKSIDISAPGESILSTSRLKGYDQRSGSSMAAPVISGVAALLMSSRPEISGFQIKKLILKGADHSEPLKNFVKEGRRVNALRALKELEGSYHSDNSDQLQSHL